MVLDACYELSKQRYPFVCHFVGNESKELSIEFMKEAVALRNLQDVVTIHGALYGEEKEAILMQSDALVFPTFYHNECFPMVILEAMKYGLPVISTSLAAIPDIIIHEETGLLIPPCELSPLVDAMSRLLDNRDFAEKMGKRGMDRHKELYTHYHFEERICAILADA